MRISLNPSAIIHYSHRQPTCLFCPLGKMGAESSTLAMEKTLVSFSLAFFPSRAAAAFCGAAPRAFRGERAALCRCARDRSPRRGPPRAAQMNMKMTSRQLQSESRACEKKQKESEHKVRRRRRVWPRGCGPRPRSRLATPGRRRRRPPRRAGARMHEEGQRRNGENIRGGRHPREK